MPRLSDDEKRVAQDLAGAYNLGDDDAYQNVVDEYGEDAAKRIDREAKRIADEADFGDAFRQITIFGRGYCGYWLRGVERDASLGWLCWEDDEQHSFDAEPDRAEALRAWRAGEPLPKGWYRLNEETAVRAFVEGVKKWGPAWFDGEHGDGNGYDVVIQMALLGEVRYG
jgi:hypothetical protein